MVRFSCACCNFSGQEGSMRIIRILACTTALAASVVQAAPAGTHPVASLSGHFAHRVVSGSPDSVVLYDQSTGDSGAAISSQNFGSDLDAYDDQAADDFMVSAGHVWKVKEVDVIGGYTEGTAESQHITVYADDNGVPGSNVAACDGAHRNHNGGALDV